MPEIKILTVLISAILAFVVGGAYYALLGAKLAEISGASTEMPPWKVGVEVLRCLVIALVVAGLASCVGADGWTDGMLLGLVLWIGFPVVLWVGAIVHESAPLALAAIHAGDWLLKLLIVGVIVSVWK